MDLKQSIEAALQTTNIYQRVDYGGVEVVVFDQAWEKMFSLFRQHDNYREIDLFSLSKQANELIVNENKVAALSQTALTDVILFHIRHEALADGHLASIIDSNHLQVLLKQLK